VAVRWEAGLGEQRNIQPPGHSKAGGFLCFTAGLLFLRPETSIDQLSRKGAAKVVIRSSAISISSARVAVVPMLTRIT